MSQFTTFCDSAVMANNIDRATELHNNALGAHGTGKQITDAVSALVGKANGIG